MIYLSLFKQNGFLEYLLANVMLCFGGFWFPSKQPIHLQIYAIVRSLRFYFRAIFLGTLLFAISTSSLMACCECKEGLWEKRRVGGEVSILPQKTPKSLDREWPNLVRLSRKRLAWFPVFFYSLPSEFFPKQILKLSSVILRI